MSSEVLLVITTCASDQEAAKLAELLVARRLAACVSRIGGIVSTYRWDSTIRNDGEVLVLAKTTANRYAELEAAVLEQTSYELPEILAVPVQGGSAGYLAWLAAAVA